MTLERLKSYYKSRNTKQKHDTSSGSGWEHDDDGQVTTTIRTKENENVPDTDAETVKENGSSGPCSFFVDVLSFIDNFAA
jgi:hypothetical protein